MVNFSIVPPPLLEGVGNQPLRVLPIQINKENRADFIKVIPIPIPFSIPFPKGYGEGDGKGEGHHL